MEKEPSLFLETVTASDAESIFLVEKTDRLGKFSLTSFRSVSKLNELGSDPFYIALNRFLMAPISVSSLLASDLKSNKHFRFNRVESRGGEEYRIHYELNDPRLFWGSGWFEVSQDSGWLITKSNCRYGNSSSKGRAITTCFFAPKSADRKPPDRVEITHDHAGADLVNDSNFHLTNFSTVATDISEFRPMKYGLPDLSRQERGGPTLTGSQILLISSPLLLIAAIILKLISRRLRRL